ncbi:MAG: class I SAM-dependent methyltransferase [Aliidongia sp.]
MMSDTRDLQAEQVAYWNGAGGAHWVAQQEQTDRVMAEIAALALARADARPGEVVIDVGCGCGATTIGLAKAVQPGGRVVALDVSAPMLDRARERMAAANVEFMLADAATHPFAETAADLLFSRFGVMFFGDPTAAFANLRRALKPGARVVFACWREPAANPWMMVPLAAAYEHVPRLPKPGPEDPGPYSFSDAARVERILTDAGYVEPSFEPVDLTMDLAVGGGLDAAVSYVLAIGATSRAIEGQPAEMLAKVTESVGRALAPFVQGNKVPLPAAIWIVRATAP